MYDDFMQKILNLKKKDFSWVFTESVTYEYDHSALMHFMG